jgi:hypothetical protein
LKLFRKQKEIKQKVFPSPPTFLKNGGNPQKTFFGEMAF